MRRSSAVKQIFVPEDEGGGRKKKGHRFQIKNQNINLMLIIFPRERKQKEIIRHFLHFMSIPVQINSR